MDQDRIEWRREMSLTLVKSNHHTPEEIAKIINYLEPIIFSDYSFVAQDSSGQIFTIIGPYQYPRNNQYNQANVIYGKGFALQGLGVFNSTKTVKYTKPSNSDIKEYLIVQ